MCSLKRMKWYIEGWDCFITFKRWRNPQRSPHSSLTPRCVAWFPFSTAVKDNEKPTGTGEMYPTGGVGTLQSLMVATVLRALLVISLFCIQSVRWAVHNLSLFFNSVRMHLLCRDGMDQVHGESVNGNLRQYDFGFMHGRLSEQFKCELTATFFLWIDCSVYRHISIRKHVQFLRQSVQLRNDWMHRARDVLEKNGEQIHYVFFSFVNCTRYLFILNVLFDETYSRGNTDVFLIVLKRCFPVRLHERCQQRLAQGRRRAGQTNHVQLQRVDQHLHVCGEKCSRWGSQVRFPRAYLAPSPSIVFACDVCRQSQRATQC